MQTSVAPDGSGKTDFRRSHQESKMRIILIGLGVLVAALSADIRTSDAQGYHNRWCTDGSGRGNNGNWSCAYATLAQCRAAASGLGMDCRRNPDFLDPRENGRRGQRRY
jgi:hypothetical protein